MNKALHTCGSHRTENLLRFNFGNGAFVLCGREKAYISELANGNFDFFHSPIWVIGHMHVHRDRLAMMIQLSATDGEEKAIELDTFSAAARSHALPITIITSLSRLASKWILFGFNINSLLTSIDGCSPNLDGAYIIFLIANLTEFRLCGLSSMCSPTNAFNS